MCPPLRKASKDFNLQSFTYFGRERHESQDSYHQKVDVRNTLELIEKGQRSPREQGIACHSYSVSVLLIFS